MRLADARGHVLLCGIAARSAPPIVPAVRSTPARQLQERKAQVFFGAFMRGTACAAGCGEHVQHAVVDLAAVGLLLVGVACCSSRFPARRPFEDSPAAGADQIEAAVKQLFAEPLGSC